MVVFEVVEGKTRKKPKPPKVPKPPTVAKLVKEYDKLFSIKVRNIGAMTTDYGVMNRCYTCENVFEVKRLHCGHYVSRVFKAVRWDYDNARPQCYGCNIYRKGDAATFRENLIHEIGEERVEAVEKKRKQEVRLTVENLQEKIKAFL